MNSGFLWILLVVALYGVLHSLLASLRAKALAQRWFGALGGRVYRIFYVIFVSITLLPVLALVWLLPDRVIYTISFPWVLLTAMLQIGSVIGLFLAFKDIEVGHFLGLSQLLDADKMNKKPRFVVNGVFRLTRHPLYLFSIIIIWLFPVMTWNVLAFNLGATLYMLIGTIPEEHKLLAAFGEDYAVYRKRTPWLIPRLKKTRQEQ